MLLIKKSNFWMLFHFYMLIRTSSGTLGVQAPSCKNAYLCEKGWPKLSDWFGKDACFGGGARSSSGGMR